MAEAAAADWPALALGLLADGRPSILVTVLAVEGSAPRGAGTRMLVTEDAISGTIGGGNLEHQVTTQARRLLARAEPHYAVQDYPLGPLLGQCCGGRVRLLLERLDLDSAGWLGAAEAAGADLQLRTVFGTDRLQRRVEPASTDGIAFLDENGSPLPATTRGERPGAGARMLERVRAERFPLLLFGAGHVGQAIARAVAPLPFALDWFDSRADFAVLTGNGAQGEAALLQHAAAATGFVLVLTHDHALDYRLVGAALGGDARFVGLIGSATKDARFRGRLGRDGVSEERLRRLRCPIGIPQLQGKAPAIIAISVAAQLLEQVEAGVVGSPA